MDKEKIIEILEDYEFFVDDDYGGHYEHIDCSQRVRTPLGILEILDYISNLEQQVKKQKEVIDKIKSLIKSKDNGTCIHNHERRGAYTFILDFDEAREFVWNLEDILKEVEND